MASITSCAISPSSAPTAIARSATRAIAHQRRAPGLPPGLRDGALDALPDGPGVYLFYGADDVLLYVGKSNDLQRRVRDHFNGDHRTRRAAELARATERVDWIETAGELGALLREAELVKRCQPLHNRRLRACGDHAIIALQEAASGYLEADVLPATSPDAWPGDQWYGPFGDRRAARRYLRDLADGHGLCPRLLGLETGRAGRPCFARQLRRCRGACTGEESGPAFNLRLLEAMGPRRIRPWPWPGPVALPERHPAASGLEETHVVDRWRYLGSARSEEEVAELANAGRDVPFDRDHYRLLRRWLERHPRAARPLLRPGDRQGVLL
jgi:DNA polymerase-3 subunit epsilon